MQYDDMRNLSNEEKKDLKDSKYQCFRLSSSLKYVYDVFTSSNHAIFHICHLNNIMQQT